MSWRSKVLRAIFGQLQSWWELCGAGVSESAPAFLSLLSWLCPAAQTTRHQKEPWRMLQATFLKRAFFFAHFHIKRSEIPGITSQAPHYMSTICAKIISSVTKGSWSNKLLLRKMTQQFWEGGGRTNNQSKETFDPIQKRSSWFTVLHCATCWQDAPPEKHWIQHPGWQATAVRLLLYTLPITGKLVFPLLPSRCRWCDAGEEWTKGCVFAT